MPKIEIEVMGVTGGWKIIGKCDSVLIPEAWCQHEYQIPHRLKEMVEPFFPKPEGKKKS